MKKLLLVLLMLSCLTSFAQYQIGLVPRSSPQKSLSQKIGYTDISVTYGSPLVRGRKIWGDLVPYDKVWRAGANEATTIEVSHDMYIQDQFLAKGKYAFFIIPEKDRAWVAVFSRKSDQWGSFDYVEEEDALRIEVVPQQTTSFQEVLTYSLSYYGYEHGWLHLSWEHIHIDIPFKTQYFELFRQEVEKRAKAAAPEIAWIVYLQGADHLLSNNRDLRLADSWLEKCEKAEAKHKKDAWNDQYYPRPYIEGHLLWTKAKLRAAQHRYEEAIELTQSLIAMENPLFYQREKEGEKIDLHQKEWAKQITQK
ncbi:MAG: DUF2911 domain-containing protein [Bacteroidota bacterium]